MALATQSDANLFGDSAARDCCHVTVIQSFTDLLGDESASGGCHVSVRAIWIAVASWTSIVFVLGFCCGASSWCCFQRPHRGCCAIEKNSAKQWVAAPSKMLKILSILTLCLGARLASSSVASPSVDIIIASLICLFRVMGCCGCNRKREECDAEPATEAATAPSTPARSKAHRHRGAAPVQSSSAWDVVWTTPHGECFHHATCHTLRGKQLRSFRMCRWCMTKGTSTG